ncbi:putative Receptor protein kinase [Melia azedarach]|uniref:Receptor protein kinase n=1 Tax=Melia azedarach TaxID=155640 RepID=A0ACC1X996_MELAZ|nr:putative Receptor protein kinase [Melia azedarach]
MMTVNSKWRNEAKTALFLQESKPNHGNSVSWTFLHVLSSIFNIIFNLHLSTSCLSDHDEYTWHMDYTVQRGDTWEKISSKFGSFVVEKPDKALIASHIVTLDVVCGCSKSSNLMTYKVETGDTLFTICSRFKADANKTAKLNGLENADLIHAGDVIFIPAPGIQNFTLFEDKGPAVKSRSKSQLHILVGSTLAAFTFIVLTVALVFWKHYKRKGTQRSKVYSRKTDCLNCYLNSCPFHTKSEESSDKATIFLYNEVRDATSNFSASLKIGQGSYGSVYLGKLRGTDVAIKQMKNTKSKEFLAELNILCKVQHSNLIELIGYAAGGDSLFLVYEYAQNGALSDHLHRPGIRGYKPLAWTTRIQIALDAAKGLEYIHEHTKPYYVHRDVKTSNILLDSNFHAKIADFGLVKLLEHSSEVAAAASRIVGTFGYLAPEYVRDGCVTTKSDVYAFGVVLMEPLTGQQALSRDSNPGNDQYSEHRSLVDCMLAVLNDTHDFMAKLRKWLDPNLTRYHKDSILQMALLSKDCVDDNWKRRPDMSNVVIRLSHILISSKEWQEMGSC